MTTHSTGKNNKAAARQSCGAVCWLGIAASPTFALMAWISARDGPQNMMCSSPLDLTPIGSMAWMYLLMSLFHVSPWLKLALGRPRPLIHHATHAEGN